MRRDSSRHIVRRLHDTIEILNRHINLLQIVLENQPIGVVKISEIMNEPHHKVRYSLRILEQEGLIVPSPHGAMTTDKVEPFVEYLLEKLKDITLKMRKLQNHLKEVVPP